MKIDKFDGKILLVTRNDEIAERERNLLSQRGIEACRVTTPEEAVEAVRQSKGISLALLALESDGGGDEIAAANAIEGSGDVVVLFLSIEDTADSVEGELISTARPIISANCTAANLLSAIRMSFRLRDTERELAAQKKKYKAMLSRMETYIQNTPAAVAVFDTEMRYLAVSKDYCHDYNLPSSDVIGKCHYEIFPEIPSRWREIHRRCLKGETLSNDMDVFFRETGETDFVKWAIHPWYDEDQQIGGIILFSVVLNKFITTYKRYTDETK